MFCKTCGVKSFGRGKGADGTALVAVVLSCVDNIPDAELASLPIMYVDGRHDNFAAAPRGNAAPVGSGQGVASLSPTMPATMSPRLARRPALADSPSSTMPSTAVPTAPTPTQTA